MKIQRPGMPPGSKNQNSGAALIIALCFLVILTGILLALYSSTRTDLINSKAFAGGQATTLLTDTAVNIVEGQITAASTQPQVAWASQPGMIHTYANSGSGTHTAYKLYSSATMVDPTWGAADQATETQNMKGWKASTDTTTSYNAVWCDLNAPAMVNRTVPGSTTTSTITPVFPIVDPGAMMTTANGSGVQGFGFSTLVPGSHLPAYATDPARRVAMPVEWIYVLKNGQLISPFSPTAGTTATFTGTVPTSANPIIGRIAFWADDDTCKLNINTASESTFWDLTRAVLPQEWYFGYNIPILGEFQTIGGHPATTCLDPVLGDLLPRPTFTQTDINTSTGSLNVTGSYTELQSYYALNPRITDTAQAYDPRNPSTLPIPATTSLGGSMSTIRNDTLVPTVVFKSDRLYATPDELLFNPARSSNNASISAATVSQRDFFITAQSRAPETTLFGTPRISLWPIQSTLPTVSNGTYQSARDQLINFCATIGGSTYSFQRGQISNVNESTYYTNLTPAATSISADWNIPRNQSIFKYATNMMETTAPGFGTSLGTKWGNPVGCERMMTMVMDFIRSGLSQVGTTAPTSATPTPVYWCYRNETPWDGLVRGAVIPLQVTTSSGTYNGMGRNWSVCSAAIQIIPTSRVTGTETPGQNGAYSDGWSAGDPQPATTGIQAALLLNFYNPMPTPQIVCPSFRVAVSNNSGLGIQAAGSSSTIGTGTILVNDRIGGGGAFLRNFAFPGYSGLFYQTSSATTSYGNLRTVIRGGTGNEPTDELQNYPFLTGTLTIPPPTGTTTTPFNITGGSITIQIMEGGGTAATAHLVQTETLTFPAWSGLALPQSALVSDSGATTGDNPANKLFSNRGGAILPGDIVAEIQLDPKGPTKGDYRLLTMERNIPANWFAPNLTYSAAVAATGTVSAFITDNSDADEVKSLQNRFAFAFQDALYGHTIGTPNGIDAPLNNGIRWGASSGAGITQGSTSINYYGGDPYGNGNNYTVNPGGLLANLKFAPDWSVAGAGLSPNSFRNLQPIIPPLASSGTVAPAAGIAVTNASGGMADWSTGFAWDGDGAILSPPDPITWQGYHTVTEPTMFVGQSDWVDTSLESVTEPNRAVPSPIILGSLPTPKAGSDLNGDGVLDDLQPWQSLLFCPNPLAGNSHPGFGTGGTGSGPTALPPFATAPPDHLLCDLFWMPVVEPYAISDPLSTAGKVNLNYEMEPFTHITRRTALVGVLTPVEIGAISNTLSYIYKNYDNSEKNPSSFPQSQSQTRFTLNLDTGTVPGGTPPSYYSGSGTATGCFSDFETRFNNGDIFRSASEVCMIDLVPTGQTASSLSTWWSGYQLTGMNLRESPYNQIYSRITTKSNTYTVHYWVQSLQQVPVAGRNWATWNENQDIKTGEYRGNTTIERYLDPNTPNLPDYTTVSLTGNYTPIDQYYSWRVVMQKQFAPGSN